jgi:YegS/Rv2252/BmrU family lipid kinase
VALRHRPPRLLVVIGNPAAGQSGRSVIRSAAGFLRRHAPRVEVGMTRARGDAEALCREAVEAGADMVVAAGGDGTINEVVNGLAGSRAALGVVPLGTANVLALELGLPLDPERACRLILDGAPRAVLPGLAGGRRFLLMAGAGLDAEVVYRTSLSWKQRIGKAAYVASGLRALMTGPRPRLTVEAAGLPSLEGAGAVIGRSSRYGGRFSVTPGASLGEPLLQVCVFTRRGRFDLLRYTWGVTRGRHTTYDDVSIFKAPRVTVSSAERVHVHADGDLLGTLPMEFGVCDEPLRIIVPPRAAARRAADEPRRAEAP